MLNKIEIELKLAYAHTLISQLQKGNLSTIMSNH